ncbi:fibronectin type III domain-containing protein [Microbacterium soli]|uniref:Fibronectin type-III domain-containing protein n=1 Tax=Microbacterium soli TaxID=446075 RepID=A0ABP7N403_9MICO
MRPSHGHPRAIRIQWRIYSWGYNGFGEIGDGSNVTRAEPVEVALPGGVAVTGVSAGDHHSLALGADEATYAWGSGGFGALGTGEISSPSSPVQVLSLDVSVTSVLFGEDPGVGLVRTGGVWTVIAPPHSAGAVDVVLGWTLGGVAQSPLTLSDGFAFLDPVTVPGVPGDVVAVPGDGEAALSWMAPGDDGGAAITGYQVECSTDGGATWMPFADAVSESAAVTVTGLENGTAYVFRVRAVNSVGAGVWSGASAPITPSAAPVPTEPPSGDGELAGTGGAGSPWLPMAGGALLLGGILLLGVLSRRNHVR